MSAATTLENWVSNNGIAGDGNSESTAWQIATAAQLESLARTVNYAESNNGTGKYFKLNQSIDLSTVCSESSGNSWAPIGRGDFVFGYYRFNGTFNGDNHTISNLYINNPNTFYRGLFGIIDSGAEIKHIVLADVNVTGESYTGGLVGENKYGTIENCHATGSVTVTYDCVGGLVGVNNAGGLAGYNDYKGRILNSSAAGSVNGKDSVGGLVGYNDDGIITNCSATSSVTGTGDSAGGLVGYNQCRGRISNSSAAGSVNGKDSVGGLVGYNREYNNYKGTITNCYATGSVTGTGSCVGGLVGDNYGTVTNCYAIGDVSSGTFVGGLIGCNNYNGTISNCSATGDVSSGNVCVGGLVGENDGTVTNCYATGTVSGYDYVGGLVGENDDGTVTNCYAIGTISGNDGVGGLVGYNYDGTIENCSATGDVSGNVCVGGLVGENDGTVTNCYATGTVSGTDDYVGGLVGGNAGTITKSIALNQQVSGTGTNVGRVVGDTGTLDNNYAWEGLKDKDSSTNSWSDKGTDKNDGADSSSSDVWANLTFYQNVFGADNISSSDDKIWKVSNSGISETGWTLPYIRTLGTPYNDFSTVAYLKQMKIPTADNFTFTAPADLTYDGTAKQATVVVKSGINGMGDISLKYYNASSGAEQQPIAAGNYKVNISVAEGANYTAASDITKDDWIFTIAQRVFDSSNVSISLVQTSFTYNGTAITPSVSVVNATSIQLSSADYELSGNVTETAVNETGTPYTITVTGKGNYTAGTFNVDWGITKAALSADNFTINPASAVYTGSPITINAALKSPLSETGIVYYYDGNTTYPAEIGTHTVNVTVVGGTNFTDVDNLTIGTFTITAPSNPPSSPSHSGSGQDTGSGNYKEYDRSVTDGGLVTFGTSPIVISVDLPKGVSGSVVLVAESETSAPSGKQTLKVFDINVQNYPSGEAATITFKLTEAEIENAGFTPADICLYHCGDNGVWTKLVTTYVIKNGIVYYESVTTDFSPFAIVYEKGAAKADETIVVPVETATAEPKPVVTTVTPVKTTAAPQATTSPMGLIGLVVGLGAVVVLRRK